MHRRQFAFGLLAMPALARRASATETSLVRLARRNEFSDLPLMVMQQHQLIERHAAKLGLPTLQPVWLPPRERGARIVDLLGGQTDFAVLGAPELLDLWDRTVGTPGEVRALSCVELQPSMLVTRNQAVKTIGDFTGSDVIGVSAVKLSPQAVCLEMAAAQFWGPEAYARLDPLTLSIANARAARSLIAGQPPVNSHYSESPYYYDELAATPAVHLVVKSNDTLGGPHVNQMLVAAPYFAVANPGVTQAVLLAQLEANALIKAHPEEAARIYLTLTQDNRKPDDMAGMVADPDIEWTVLPQRLMEFAAFLHKVGRLNSMPRSWKDLTLPENQSGTGS